jgi:hypothetical protein
LARPRRPHSHGSWSNSEAVQIELPNDAANHASFLGFHSAPRSSPFIVIPPQVKQAVDDVPDEFAAPRHAKAAGLGFGFLQANEDVPGQASGFTIIEGDHIRWPGVLEIGFVQVSNFWRVHDVNAEFKYFAFKIFPKYSLNHPPKFAAIQFDAGAISNCQAPHDVSLGELERPRPR